MHLSLAGFYRNRRTASLLRARSEVALEGYMTPFVVPDPSLPMTVEDMLSIPAIELGDQHGASAQPLVSVLMITYNHQNFIADAIEGVIKQKSDFGFELIIGEDCSTDNTLRVCEQYQREYPSVIRLVTGDANVGVARNFWRVFGRARGKYIALCEGDDIWTVPDKLQSQVELMEANPSCPLCFTWADRISECPDGAWQSVREEKPQPQEKGLSLQEIMVASVRPHTCTLLLRRGIVAFPKGTLNLNVLDWLILFFHADKGNVFMLPRVTAVYREHIGGWSGSNVLKRRRDTLRAVNLADDFFGLRFRRYFAERRAGQLLHLAALEALDGNKLFSARLSLAAIKAVKCHPRWLLRREFLAWAAAFSSTRFFRIARRALLAIESLIGHRL